MSTKQINQTPEQRQRFILKSAPNNTSVYDTERCATVAVGTNRRDAEAVMHALNALVKVDAYIVACFGSMDPDEFKCDDVKVAMVDIKHYIRRAMLRARF